MGAAFAIVAAAAVERNIRTHFLHGAQAQLMLRFMKGRINIKSRLTVLPTGHRTGCRTGNGDQLKQHPSRARAGY